MAITNGTSEVNGRENSRTHQTTSLVQADVVVIGGGFAGLQAAYDVHCSGHSCVLLEATDRVGGRSWTKQLTTGDGLVELGATWINKHTQPKVYKLSQVLGLDCVPQYEIGATIWQSSDGTIWRTDRGDLPFPPNATNDDNQLYRLLQEMEEAQSEIEIMKPTSFETAKDMTVEEWIMMKKFGPWPSDFMRQFTAALVGREAREVGLHYIMDYIKSGGGFISLASEGEYGAQSLKIKQGTSAIATGLASRMAPGSIFLRSPVSSVDHHGKLCTVKTANGIEAQCSRVIFAIPTNTYTKIRVTPPLPYKKRALVSRTKPGVYAKMVLTYNKPWWRDLGLVGTFITIKGPINFSWDISDDTTGHYSLALFLAGDSAGKWHSLPDLAKEEAVINHLIQLVGEEHASVISDVYEINFKAWSKEEWIGGAPTSAMDSTLLSKYGDALRAPFGNLHFGGGETAYEWKGYLEGALRSGSRVAQEVIAELNSKSSL